MLTALKKTASVTVLICIAFLSHAQLIITSNSNAQQLAQKLVGSGISISNVTLTGNAASTGFFNNVSGTQINLDSGIVLTTGSALTTGTIEGMNGAATLFASTSHGTPGDAQLSALIGGSTTNDATILEFDFVPIGDTVRFRYVFGSEEYPGFTCSSFNDVFAFFISGPGITGTQNLALVPGTNIPVAINSINDGIDVGPNLCTQMGPGSPFTQYYINNSGSANFTYGGHTTVLTAQAIVVPCQTYHLKIAIADVGDAAYDSGVLLEARSLTSTPLQIINGNPTTNTGIPYVIEGCTAGSIKIARQRKFSFPQPVTLAYTGTATNGIDVMVMPTSIIIPANDSIVTLPINPILDNVLEGDETFKIYVTFGSCGTSSNFYADSITILIRDQLAGSATITPSNCSNNSGSISISVPPNNGNPPYTYAINGGNFQSSNSFTGLGTGTSIVTVRDSNGCVHNIVSTIGLTNNLAVNLQPADTAVCVGASFTPRVTSLATSYSWSPGAGLSSSTVKQPTITVNANSQYIVTAYQGACSATDTINITAFPGPQVDAGPDQTIISGDQILLQATAGAGTYLWSPPAGLSASNILNPMASPMQNTVYTLTATTSQGCTSSDQVSIVVLNCFDPQNAFTPNGDGINDVWMVNLRDCFTKSKVEVFNRYGGKVFESTAYKNDWNGKFKGNDLPDGTYYYVITLDLINGKKVYHKGNVTILR